jgi:vacuolar protein sorting-associated protein 13D
MNILLVRSTKVNNTKTVRKVAEVTVSEVQINASFIEGQSISGSLGGLRIMDLTPEGSLHRCVLTCGVTLDADLHTEDPYRLTKLPDDQDDAPADSRAFKFSLVRPAAGQKYPSVILNPIQNNDKEIAEITKNVQVSIRMATAQYTHTQRFLSELMLCGGDFSDSAKDVGESLRQAASSVAMGLVSKKKALIDELDYLSSSFIAPSREMDTLGSRRHSILSDEGIASELLFEGQDFEDNLATKPNKRVYISVEIEAPVIHFPRSSSSADILVANLGEITIRNTHMVEIIEEVESKGAVAIEYDIDRVQVDIQDMSLYSITLSTDDLTKLSSGQTLSESLLGGSPSKVPKSGIHILHKTGLQVCVDRRSDVQEILQDTSNKTPTICVDARILTPLKLELSTYTYEQLLNTVDNLGGEKSYSKVPPPASGQSSPLRSPSTRSPNMSPS